MTEHIFHPLPMVRARNNPAIGAGVAAPCRVITRYVARGFSLISLWAERGCQRRALGTLDPHILKDIGLSPDAVRRECAKPFWKA